MSLSSLLGLGGDIYSSERQMAFQRESMQKRYQWMVKDLEKAGLNRMLAIGGATPPGMAPGAGFSASSALSSGKQASAAKSQADSAGVRANAAKELAEDQGYAAFQQGRLAQEKQNTERSTQDLQKAQAAEAATRTQLNEYQMNSAKAASDLYKQLPQLRQAGEVLSPILRMLRLIK